MCQPLHDRLARLERALWRKVDDWPDPYADELTAILQMSGHVKGDPIGMLLPYVQEGMTVVDVGAAHGEVTKRLAKMVGEKGHVLAFDADRRNRDEFPKVANIELECVAVADRVGEHIFYPTTPGTQSSLFPNMPQPPAEPVTVPMFPLDDLVSSAEAIKIDTQGAEPLVLRGATRLLQTCPTWVIELWPGGLMSGDFTCLDVLEPLWEAGLTVWFADGVEVTRESLDAWLSGGPNFVNILARRV